MFATQTDYLRMFANLDWGPRMPEYETLGVLTAEMLLRGVKPYEMQEDKNSIYFDGTKDGDKSKDLGYYHIRSGSVPALLLAYKYNDPDKCIDYLKHQPKREYLRQLAWYYEMCDTNEQTWMLRPKILELVRDSFIGPGTHITELAFIDYCEKLRKYHGLNNKMP